MSWLVLALGKWSSFDPRWSPVTYPGNYDLKVITAMQSLYDC